MADPYHYVRVMRSHDRDMLIVGGEDHKTGQANDMAERYRCLEDWTRRHFAVIGKVEYRWLGQIMEPIDSRPSSDATRVTPATSISRPVIRGTA